MTWTLAPGSTPLPPGLALAANGTIAGTPTQTGTFPFAVQATDSDVPARTDTRDLSITIDPAAPVASFEVINVLEDGSAEPNIYLNNPAAAISEAVLDRRRRRLNSLTASHKLVFEIIVTFLAGLGLGSVRDPMRSSKYARSPAGALVGSCSALDARSVPYLNSFC